MLPKLPVICVVEDDAAVRTALKFALEMEGLDVRVYDGPVSLLNDPNLPPSGCLVVDYRMPVMDGLELISVLRSRGIDAPAILITGRANEELRARAQRLDVQYLLEKPLSDNALLDSIRSALARPR
ncbi:MAG: response regulator [Enhydrobacter sp.]|nr:response regulator [Enhydrobacter sp.]